MKNKFLQGMVKRHPDGFGFFIPEQSEHPDVYIPRHSMKGAMTNDKVMIEVFPERGSARFRGEILKIVSRGTTSVVGSFHRLNERTGLIKDDGKGWGEDLRVDMADSLDAQNGELVSAEIISYPGDGSQFKGKVREVIGNSLDPLTDIKRVLFQNSIPQEFPESVIKEAAGFSELVSDADLKNRKDLRPLKFITIDGSTAKDFDDAILVETNDRGFKLWVGIADVSHYVRPGTAIDKEAYSRGTSVYFPNFVVPMLPEVLSNGLCSLNPHIPRLALVAEIQMDFTGQTTSTDFYEAVIESKARVTYGEAQEIIDGNEVEKIQHVKAEILLAADLAKILMAKRFREGSLDLEIPEVSIVIDGAGVPVDFIRSERLFAHRLIEEMMLSANVAVAKFFDAKEVAAIYRIHDTPHEDALAILERYLALFGGQLNATQGVLQKRLTRALQDFEGKPEAQILNVLALRSMSQAKYSSGNVGHFGLGFEFYTHFTSPIRRYPDLIVHRLLKALVMPKSGYRLISEEDLNSAATMLSACEQRSVKAERQFQSIKKARFMQKHLGEEFEGIIGSVTKFGVFVLLRTFEVDGLIRLENLSKEKLEFDEENLVLFGRKTGQTFSIGDTLKIQVAAADPEAGQVDFSLVEILSQHESGKMTSFPPPAQKQDGAPFQRVGRNQKDRKRPEKERAQKRFSGKPAPERSARKSNERIQEKQIEKSGRMAPPKSRKVHALDKMAQKVFDYLSEANANFKNNGKAGDKSGDKNFDPEKHLQQAVKKWKERNVDAPAGKRNESSRPREKISLDKKSDENSEQKKLKKGQAFFHKFRKSTNSEKTGGSSSSGRSQKSGGKNKGKGKS